MLRASTAPKIEFDLEGANEALGCEAISTGGKNKPVSIVRTRSFSGTFVSSQLSHRPTTMTSSNWSLPLGALLLGALFAFAVVAGVWTSVRQAEQRALAIETDIHEIKSSLETLTLALREQGQLHLQSSTALKAEQLKHTQGVESLKAAQAHLPAMVTSELLPKFGRLETAISSKLPTLEQISSTLSVSFADILQRVTRLEAAVSSLHVHTPSVTAHPPSATLSVRKPVLQAPPSAPPTAPKLKLAYRPDPTTPRGDGTVRVTFRFSGSAGTAAALFWVGRQRADGKYTEIKYSEIPHGMQVVETTRPGECWRAREAKSGTSFLELYCATIEPTQEAFIHG